MHRKNLMILRSCGLLCAALTVHSLNAAPDPDLFDGRVTPQRQESESENAPATPPAEGGGGGQESANSGQSGESQESSTESRDFESIGGAGGGEGVQSQSSKEASSVSSGSGSSGSGAQTGGEAGGQTSSGGSGGDGEAGAEESTQAASGGGGGSSESIGESTNASASGGDSGETRDFEAFGFGGSGAVDPVEVNRSKAGSEPTKPSNGGLPQMPAPDAGDPSSGTGTTPGASSQPRIGNQSGDYGTNLPSGL